MPSSEWADQAMALATQMLDWDTAFFGVRAARIVPESADAEQLGEALTSLRAQGVQWVTWASDPQSGEAQRAAEAHGGVLVDVKRTYRRPTRPAPAIPASARRWQGSGATPALYALALESGRHSRFRTDPAIPDSAFEALYRRWLDASLSGELASAVFVIEQAGAPRGLVTVGEREESSVIGLLAVDAAHRGQGVGRQLVEAALGWADTQQRERAEVVTQRDNRPACALYEASGYALSGERNVHHFWLDARAWSST